MKLICPRCHEKPTILREFWTGNCIEFGVDKNGVIDLEGVKQEGYPSHVEAMCCNCNYRWRVRNVTQISHLREKGTP